MKSTRNWEKRGFIDNGFNSKSSFVLVLAVRCKGFNIFEKPGITKTLSQLSGISSWMKTKTKP